MDLSLRRKLRILCLIVVDLLALITSYWLTLYLRFRVEFINHFFTFINRSFGLRSTGIIPEELFYFYCESVYRIVALVAISLFSIYALFGLYDDRRFLRRARLVKKVISANFCALMIYFCYLYLTRNVYHPRSFFLMLMATNIFITLILRFLYERINYTFLRLDSSILVVERDKSGERISRLLQAFGRKVSTIAIEQDISQALEKIKSELLKGKFGLIIFALPDLAIKDIMILLKLMEDMNIHVGFLSKHFDVLVTRAKIDIDVIGDYPLVFFGTLKERKFYTEIKHILSIFIAFIGLILIFPLVLLIALLIFLIDGRPVFFAHERIGEYCKPFILYKFRTMRDIEDGELLFYELESKDPVIFKVKSDPRVTAFGRILRRFSLDEIPQLINVIKGDMDLIGPRPLPRRDFENYYEEWHYMRHAGKPGITGLWQVSGRSELGFLEMCILDIYYLKNQNWMLDMKILFRTLIAILLGEGAY